MSKKIIAIFLCISILTTLCLTVSATTATFNGSSSGGNTGSVAINGKISTDLNYAYYTSVGFFSPNPSANYSMSVVGHLYVLNSPSGGARIIDRNITGGGTESSLGNAGRTGYETNYPPNGYNGQYSYQRVVVTVRFSSVNYGSWNGSGQMIY